MIQTLFSPLKRTTALLLTLAVLAGCGGPPIPRPDASVPEGRPVPTDASTILSLYQMMKDIHEVLESAQVTYWAEGGTLMGAVRHHGIIPRDDDLDIDIMESDEQKILDLKTTFSVLGYILETGPDDPFFGFRLRAMHNRELALDIFVMKEKKGKLFYKHRETAWGHRDGLPMHYIKEEVFPLKQYSFGQFFIKGAHNPKPFLDAMYGDNWMEVGFQYQSHTGPTPKKVKLILTEEDHIPAEPTGPLEDRVPYRDFRPNRTQFPFSRDYSGIDA